MSLNHLTNALGDKINIFVKDVDSNSLTTSQLFTSGEIITPSITTSIIKNASDKIFSTSIPSLVVLNTASVSPVGYITALTNVTYSTSEQKKYNPDTLAYENTLKFQLFFRYETTLPPAAAVVNFELDLGYTGDYQNKPVLYSFAQHRVGNSQVGEPYMGIKSINTSVGGIAKVLIQSSTHLDVFPSPNYNTMYVEFELARQY